MKILWLCPRWPWPPRDGARQASVNLLEPLASVAAEAGVPLVVDAVFFSDEPAAAVPAGVELGAALCLAKASAKLPRPLGYAAHLLRGDPLPFTVAPFAHAEARRRLAAWAERRAWDFTVLDGLHVYPLLAEIPRPGQLVYRAHNVESELWRQSERAAKPGGKRYALGREYRRVLEAESRLVARARLTLPVSAADAVRFRSFAPGAAVHPLPIGFPLGAALSPPPGSAGLRLLFVGRLDWPPNREGLAWFLREVWPELPAGTRLRIVGSGSAAWLKSWLRGEGRIELYSSAPELSSHYGWCHLALLPLFTGSGTRVKGIEAALHGRSFCASTLGAEGLPFSAEADYLRVNGAREWVRALTNLSAPEAARLGASIRLRAEETFGRERIAAEFLRLLEATS